MKSIDRVIVTFFCICLFSSKTLADTCSPNELTKIATSNSSSIQINHNFEEATDMDISFYFSTSAALAGDELITTDNLNSKILVATNFYFEYLIKVVTELSGTIPSKEITITENVLNVEIDDRRQFYRWRDTPGGKVLEQQLLEHVGIDLKSKLPFTILSLMSNLLNLTNALNQVGKGDDKFYFGRLKKGQKIVVPDFKIKISDNTAAVQIKRGDSAYQTSIKTAGCPELTDSAYQKEIDRCKRGLNFMNGAFVSEDEFATHVFDKEYTALIPVSDARFVFPKGTGPKIPGHYMVLKSDELNVRVQSRDYKHLLSKLKSWGVPNWFCHVADENCPQPEFISFTVPRSWQISQCK